MVPHTMKPELGQVVMSEFTPKEDFHQVYAIHVYFITRIQIEITIITEDNIAPFHSPVDSFTTAQEPCLAL